MRLLFMSTLALTLHETSMGLDLADQLIPAGVESHFVIDAGNEAMLRSSRHAYTTVTSALGKRVEDVVAGVVRGFRPDAIVLSDYTAHWMTHVISYDTDPWYVERFGLPVIPIDLYDLTHTSREVEILGRTMRVSDRILHMPAHLWPIPGVRPHAAPDGPALPYRADPTVRPLSTAAVQKVRDELAVPARCRLLTIPALPWQHLMQTRAGPLTRELARRVPFLIAGYLAKLHPDTHFLFLGPWFDGFDRLPRERVRHRSAYTAPEYLRLLGASDGVLALFLPSFALERALLMDVPGLFVTNSHRLDSADADGPPEGLTPDVRSWLTAFPGAVPPFHMWPLQWNKVVGPLLESNPFTATAVRTELFDEDAVVSGLEAILHHTATREALAAGRADFRRAMELLPDTPDVFFTAARRVGLSG